MPNLPAHIELARRAAERLGHPELDSFVGYFLLGSTSPDVRAITKGRREDYHFASLDFEAVGAGTNGLFNAHPHLLSPTKSHWPTRAFVAGYITHLILDEVWIVEIYRPYFSNPAAFKDEAHGQVMDRALQLELDHMSQENARDAVRLLAQATDQVDVGFISTETLAQWHRFVLGFMDREFTWERLRFMARRIAGGDDAHPAHRIADEFIRDVPGSLERLYAHVARDELVSFEGRCVNLLTEAVGEYLS